MPMATRARSRRRWCGATASLRCAREIGARSWLALPCGGRTGAAGSPNVRAPTLILWGAQDRLIPVSHAVRFEHAIPAARLIVYDGVGHVPMEEIGQRSAADVEAFLAGKGMAGAPEVRK